MQDRNLYPWKMNYGALIARFAGICTDCSAGWLDNQQSVPGKSIQALRRIRRLGNWQIRGDEVQI